MMKKGERGMLKICLTYDYELFFGTNNGTPREVLFEPTEELIDMLHEEKVQATFFADVCSVFMSGKYGDQLYVADFEKQILKMNRCGQDVQLHIHSHWMDSKLVNGQWEFDGTRYKLHSFGFDENDSESANALIKRGVEYLNNIIRKEAPDYKCIAFRAGGYSLQPHSELVKALYNAGIRVDSSVALMQKAESKTHKYDYQRKYDYLNWKISPEKEWWEDADPSENALLEIPVGAENKNLVAFLVRRLINPSSVKLNLGPKRGSYIGIEAGVRPSRSLKSIANYLVNYSLLSMDSYKAEYLYKQIKRLARRYHCDKQNHVIALIGHPKLVNPTYVQNVRDLIHRINQDDMMCITSIQDVRKEIVNGGRK